MHINKPYLHCVCFAVLGFIFFIVAMSVPDLTTWDFVYTRNGNLSDDGVLKLGMFQMCREGFDSPSLYNKCGVYTRNFLFTSEANKTLDVCGQIDISGDRTNLLFCEKRKMVEAFTLVATFAAVTAIAICLKILIDDWDNGFGIYCPGIFTAVSGLASTIAMCTWASYLRVARVNGQFSVGVAFYFLLFGSFLMFVASFFGYRALLVDDSKGIKGNFKRPRVLDLYQPPSLIPRNMMRS